MPDITVHRVTYEEHRYHRPIPHGEEFVEEVQDPEGRYIHDILAQEGADGAKEVTTRAKYIDGTYISSEVVAETVLVPAQNAVYKRIQNNMVSPLPAPDGVTVENNVPSSYSQVYTMKATGYYSPRGKGASGLGLYYGTFAVDPTLIPYGTKVYIVSTDGEFVYGWAIATDTGAFIHQNRMQIDLFYETYEESAANGVKRSIRLCAVGQRLPHKAARETHGVHRGPKGCTAGSPLKAAKWMPPARLPHTETGGSPPGRKPSCLQAGGRRQPALPCT